MLSEKKLFQSLKDLTAKSVAVRVCTPVSSYVNANCYWRIWDKVSETTRFTGEAISEIASKVTTNAAK